MDIGGILKARRVRRDETLEDVAFRAGTDAGNLSRIERNRQDVSVQRLGRLCDALEMSFTELDSAQEEARRQLCEVEAEAAAIIIAVDCSRQPADRPGIVAGRVLFTCCIGASWCLVV